MRLLHVVRSFTATALLSSIVLLASTSASALIITSPTEGRIVRDKVKIVIPKSSLPADITQTRFISIKVDGQFLAAIDTSSDAAFSDAKNPNIVYVWDTKRAIANPLISEDQRYYKDGMHDIVVEAHSLGANKKDIVTETASVAVNLKNQIPRADPAPPLKLRYRYHFGQQSTYNVSVEGEILDPTGLSLTGGVLPVQGEFDVAQSVEDVQGDGSALIRYKVDKDTAWTLIYGQSSLPGQNVKFRSVYKIIDSLGKTVDSNVLSGNVKIEVTDCLIRLPSRSIQIGDTWPTETRMKLEGFADTVKLTGTSSLVGLEWESNLECAKIVSELSGEPVFTFLPYNGGMIKITNIAYFAHKLGKLVKDVTVIQYDTIMDTALLANIQQQVFPASAIPAIPSSPTSSTSPSGGPMAAARRMPTAPSMPGMAPISPAPGISPGGTSLSSRTVKVRLIITKELQK
jgi:hypothetical protein